MKFFNDLYEQARAAVLAMPPGNRVIALGLLVAVAVSLGFLVRGGGSGSGVYLFGGRVLDEGEIDRAESAFSQAELREWERVGNRLRVPASEKDQYLRALSEAGALPRELDWATQEAIKSFNPFEPNAQREDRLAYADRQDLQHAIEQFPEVKSALIQVAEERHGLSGQRPTSASVIITPQGTQTISAQREEDIKKMVAAAFPNMNADKVVVTDTNRAPGSSWFPDDDDPYHRAKRKAEIEYEEKVRALLHDYGPLRLATYAEIDPTVDTNSTTLRYQGNPLTIAERATQKTSENVRPGPGGVPGVASNAYGNKATSIENRDQTSKMTESVEAADRVLGQEQTRTRSIGMIPKKITVAVGVPQSYLQIAFRREWLSLNPDKQPADAPTMTAADRERLEKITTTSIQENVTAILPQVPAGADKFPLVSVMYYPDEPRAPVVEAASSPAVMKWLADSWQSLALIGFALVALLLVRSFVKSSPQPEEPEFAGGFGLTLPELPEDELSISGGEGGNAAGVEITGIQLKDDLTDLIENNPDAAANILRAWIEDEKDKAA